MEVRRNGSATGNGAAACACTAPIACCTSAHREAGEILAVLRVSVRVRDRVRGGVRVRVSVRVRVRVHHEASAILAGPRRSLRGTPICNLQPYINSSLGKSVFSNVLMC